MVRRPKILSSPEPHDARAVFTRSRHRLLVHHETGADLGQLVSVGQHESGGIPDQYFLSLADCMLNPSERHAGGAFADVVPDSREEEPPTSKIPGEREARFLLHYNQR